MPFELTFDEGFSGHFENLKCQEEHNLKQGTL